MRRNMRPDDDWVTNPGTLVFAIVLGLVIGFMLKPLVAGAQEPTETATASPTNTPVTPTSTATAPAPADGRLTWELRGEGCVDIEETRGNAEHVSDFRLCGDEDGRSFRLDAGRYRFELEADDGYRLYRVSCHGKNASEFTNAGDDEATVVMAPGRDVTCIAWTRALATPTATSTPSPTQTPVVVVRERFVFPPTPVPTSTPFQVVAPVQRVTPPSTGDGGLLN